MNSLLNDIKNINLKSTPDKNTLYHFRKKSSSLITGVFVDVKDKIFLLFAEEQYERKNGYYTVRFIIGRFDDELNIKDIGALRFYISRIETNELPKVSDLKFFAPYFSSSEDAFIIIGTNELPGIFFYNFLANRKTLKLDKSSFLQLFSKTTDILNRNDSDKYTVFENQIYKSQNFVLEEEMSKGIKKYIPIQINKLSDDRLIIFVGSKSKIKLNDIKNEIFKILSKEDFDGMSHIISNAIYELAFEYEKVSSLHGYFKRKKNLYDKLINC